LALITKAIISAILVNAQRRPYANSGRATARGLYPHRTARRYRHHRHPRRDPLPRFRPGARKGTLGGVYEQPQTVGHGRGDVSAGLRRRFRPQLLLQRGHLRLRGATLLVVRPPPAVYEE